MNKNYFQIEISKRYSFLIIFIVLLFLNSCDQSYYITEIKIENKSAYDLRLNFIQNPDATVLWSPDEYWDYEDIDINKNSTAKIELYISMSGNERNPNNEFMDIIIKNLNDLSILNEVKNNGLFKYNGEKKISMSGYRYFYSLELTNTLIHE